MAPPVIRTAIDPQPASVPDLTGLRPLRPAVLAPQRTRNPPGQVGLAPVPGGVVHPHTELRAPALQPRRLRLVRRALDALDAQRLACLLTSASRSRGGLSAPWEFDRGRRPGPCSGACGSARGREATPSARSHPAGPLRRCRSARIRRPPAFDADTTHATAAPVGAPPGTSVANTPLCQRLAVRVVDERVRQRGCVRPGARRARHRAALHGRVDGSRAARDRPVAARPGPPPRRR